MRGTDHSNVAGKRLNKAIKSVALGTQEWYKYMVGVEQIDYNPIFGLSKQCSVGPHFTK